MRFACIALALAVVQPTIPQITETLEKVQKGLGNLHGIDGLDALQADIESTLMTLKAKSKTDDEKRLAAKHVEEEIKEFKQVLTARQDELQAQTESAGKLQNIEASATGNSLFADLIAVQDAPMDEQLKVLQDPKYKDLDVAKAVLAMKHDDGESLALTVGHFLDGHHDEAKSPTKNAADQLSAIQGSLAARSKRLQAEVRAMDKTEDSREAQAKSSLGLKTDAETDGIAKAAQALKFFDKAAHRKFLKSRAIKVAEEADLDKAVAAIKRHDVKAVTRILDSLKKLDPKPIVL